jgi:raffinose/stachyose/melibiose transport system permease protein
VKSKKVGALKHLKRFGIFAALPLFIFGIVLVFPFMRGIFLTFTNWDGFDYDSFVGLDNYALSIQDEAFWSAMTMTFGYVLASLILVNLVGTNVFRTFFFVPNLIGGVILGLIWQFIFASALPSLSELFSLPFFTSDWLLTPTTAFWAMVIVTVWQMGGYMMIIYITGLMSIEKDVLEAAIIDGASAFRTLMSIKIPLMAQAFTISMFLTIRNSFMAYDLNLSLTGGGPYRSTELISLHVFKEAFGFGNFATGQSQAVMMFLVIAVAALTQVVLSKRAEVQR